MSIGDLPESVSQGILVGTIFVEGLGVVEVSETSCMSATAGSPRLAEAEAWAATTTTTTTTTTATTTTTTIYIYVCIYSSIYIHSYICIYIYVHDNNKLRQKPGQHQDELWPHLVCRAPLCGVVGYTLRYRGERGELGGDLWSEFGCMCVSSIGEK